MDQIFNELSLSASLPDNYAANEALQSLEKASKKLVTYSFSRNIRVTEDFRTRHITPGCTISEHLKSMAGGQQRTLRDFLLKQFTGAPYVEQLYSDAGITELEEYTLDGSSCRGLALASHFGIPALSLSGDSRFSPPYTTLTYTSMGADSSEIYEEERQVGIICREEDINHHLNDIKKALTGAITTGEELLNYGRRWLPCLRFSKEAEDQLMDIQSGDTRLPRIRDILNELQRAMQQAVANQTFFSPQGFKYTPAESSTATQGKNREKHTFRFVEPDATGNPIQLTLLCEPHMRINDGERVYFFGDRNKGRVYVGHIGAHLPGKKFG